MTVLQIKEPLISILCSKPCHSLFQTVTLSVFLLLFGLHASRFMYCHRVCVLLLSMLD